MQVEETFDHSTFDYWFRLGHICTYLLIDLWMEADHQGGNFNRSESTKQMEQTLRAKVKIFSKAKI